MRSTKQEIARLMACKIDGICERDQIVNDYLIAGMESWVANRATKHEAMRAKMDLPPCPPVCTDPNDSKTYVIERTEIL